MSREDLPGGRYSTMECKANGVLANDTDFNLARLPGVG